MPEWTEMVRDNEQDPDGGTESPRCIIAVNSDGKVILIEITNLDTALCVVVDQIDEYLDFEGYEIGDLNTGVYLVDVIIQQTTDYHTNEVDAWLEFHNIKQYKLEEFEEEKK